MCKMAQNRVISAAPTCTTYYSKCPNPATSPPRHCLQGISGKNVQQEKVPKIYRFSCIAYAVPYTIVVNHSLSCIARRFMFSQCGYMAIIGWQVRMTVCCPYSGDWLACFMTHHNTPCIMCVMITYLLWIYGVWWWVIKHANMQIMVEMCESIM